MPPLLDDKVIAAWNGLMIGAMAEGFRVLRDRRYLESAERAAGFVWSTLRRPDGGLYRTARHGRAHLDACLEDYAYLADAFVTLYEAGGALAWLDRALELGERILSDFSDGADPGGFFATARGHEKLVARPREGHDGAVPNANAVAARALARLARHFDRAELAERAAAALDAFGAHGVAGAARVCDGARGARLLARAAARARPSPVARVRPIAKRSKWRSPNGTFRGASSDTSSPTPRRGAGSRCSTARRKWPVGRPFTSVATMRASGR